MSSYAFITGATSGIGLASAKALAARGMDWLWLPEIKKSWKR